jgi:DMSO/TMAO reductase YedYZ molybdopterin-dependent catalytic subunit
MPNYFVSCLSAFVAFAMPVFAEVFHAPLKTAELDLVVIAEPAQQERGLVVQRAGKSSHLLSPDRIGGLPRITQRVSFMTGSGEQQNEWAGPLLWNVLGASGVIDGADPREQAHLVVRVTGADGYAAVISLGEISPQLADRPILLADQLNGSPLPDHTLRLIVPGDRLGARSVRDVVRIAIE